MPLIYVLVEMEVTGVKLDTVALKQSSEELTAALNNLEKRFTNWQESNSILIPANRWAKSFRTSQDRRESQKTKTGSYSTSEDILEKMRSKHPVVGKLLEYRGLKKLLSTYIDALPELINPETGKIHTSFNQTVTATGRLSSDESESPEYPYPRRTGT